MNDRRGLSNPRLKREISAVIEQQLRDGDPPETRQALARLLGAGYPRETAVALIGAALLEEIEQMLRERRPFDRGQFKALMDQVQ